MDSNGKPVQMNRAMRGWLINMQKWFEEKIDTVGSGTSGHFVSLASYGQIKSSGKEPPSGTIVGDIDAQELKNKTLDEPVIGVIHHSSAKTRPITVPVPDGSTEVFVIRDSIQTLTNKTLTEPVISVVHHNAAKTKPITMPTPDGSSDTLVIKDSVQTLIKKDVRLWQATHDYAGGVADWTLSATEETQTWLKGTNSSGDVNIIATPTLGAVKTVTNGTASNMTIKANGGTGVTIATIKTADVVGDGTDFTRKTPDA